MTDASLRIENELMRLADPVFRDFNAKLLPNIPKESAIGVKIPIIRDYSVEAAKMADIGDFLRDTPHRYLEENCLHAYIIEKIKDYGECVKAIDDFLPYVDNWAVCDTMSPKVFKRNTALLINDIKRWLSSSETYTVRYGVVMLIRYFLDDSFSPEICELAASVKSDEYYVGMAVAWFFATALAKQYDSALPYIEGRRLAKEIHNKAISKAIESRRVSPEHKDALRLMKIKD